MSLDAANFVRTYPPSIPDSGEAIWLPFRGNELLVQLPVEEATKSVSLLRGTTENLEHIDLASPIYIGTLAGVPCLAGRVDAESELPAGVGAIGLRSLYGVLDEGERAVAGYASQILHWLATSNFCPNCGHGTEQKPHDWGKVCPNCGHSSYPSVHPAVLVLIHDGENILLSHKAGWGTRYSILAGFTEPGESLEECAIREVFEEVGLRITDLVYDGSQPWPFPHQLMVGITARVAGGELKIDEEELDDARWFSVHDMPNLPSPMSLARKMIDRWVTSVTQASH